MDASVTILRALWRHRTIIVVFAIVSALIGGLIAYKPSLPPHSRKYHLGAAHLQILVDTPASQVVEVSPKGSETLGDRASLLANLMTQGEVKAAIAKRAGLRPGQLLAVSDAAIEPKNVTPAQLSSPGIYLLRTNVVSNDAGNQLPIVEVDAQAPTAARAAVLANAAEAGLRDYLDTKAALEKVTDARRLRVRGLGAALPHDVARGPGKLLAVFATLFVFGTLCGGFLLTLALARGWLLAKRDEDLGVLIEDDDALIEPLDDDPAAELWAEPREPEATRVAASSGELGRS